VTDTRDDAKSKDSENGQLTLGEQPAPPSGDEGGKEETQNSNAAGSDAAPRRGTLVVSGPPADEEQSTNPDSPTPAAPKPLSPQRELSKLGDALDRMIKESNAALRAINSVPNAMTMATADKWRASLRRIEESSLPEPTLRAQVDEVCAKLNAELDTLEKEAGRRFVEDLKSSAARQDITLKLIGESPLALLVNPLTVECDVDKGTASISFGKELIERVALDVRSVMRVRDETVRIYKEHTPSPTELFQRYHRAYQMALLEAGLPPGERIDIVDLFPYLSVLAADRGALRRANPRPIEVFPRHRVSYDLYSMRKGAALEHGGTRIDLGAAVGGSTKKKQDVLFVPTGPAEGQYYLSIRFVATTETSTQVT